MAAVVVGRFAEASAANIRAAADNRRASFASRRRRQFGDIIAASAAKRPPTPRPAQNTTAKKQHWIINWKVKAGDVVKNKGGNCGSL